MGLQKVQKQGKHENARRLPCYRKIHGKEKARLVDYELAATTQFHAGG